jgi:hypothetical protein
MDAFVALLTPDFHASKWTDQKIGFAFARGVPIVAVRMGLDPYGFIEKFQALSSSWSNCAVDVAKVLIKNDRMVLAYLRALPACQNWDAGNKLAKVLPEIEHLSQAQIDDLVAAFNETGELRGAFGFNGKNPWWYGDGLVSHLNRLGPRQFSVNFDGLIEQTK